MLILEDNSHEKISIRVKRRASDQEMMFITPVMDKGLTGIHDE